MSARYGKAAVRVLVPQTAPRAGVLDLTMEIAVEGALLDAFHDGDNRDVLPSDTLRRHALAAIAEAPAERRDDVYALLGAVADRVLRANPVFTRTVVSAEQEDWREAGEHSFVGAATQRCSTVDANVDGSVRRGGGVRGLRLLATTGNAFTGFLHDALTVQEEAADRPLCGVLDGTWRHREAPAPVTPPTSAAVIDRLLDLWRDRSSASVQQLLTDVAERTLRATPELDAITLRFESLSLDPNPFGGDVTSFEVGGTPRGVTEVTIAAPAAAGDGEPFAAVAPATRPVTCSSHD